MRTDLRTMTRIVAIVAIVATASAALAPTTSAIPSAGDATASAYASESSGTVCASSSVGMRCAATGLRTNAAFYAGAGARLDLGGCEVAYCPPVTAGYYGYATPDGRNYIVIGPGPNPPPSCGFTCPSGLVKWVLDQLP